MKYTIEWNKISHWYDVRDSWRVVAVFERWDEAFEWMMTPEGDG